MVTNRNHITLHTLSRHWNCYRNLKDLFKLSKPSDNALSTLCYISRLTFPCYENLFLLPVKVSPAHSLGETYETWDNHIDLCGEKNSFQSIREWLLDDIYCSCIYLCLAAPLSRHWCNALQRQSGICFDLANTYNSYVSTKDFKALLIITLH